MTRDEQFFYDNAGYSYNPQTETPDQGRLKCAQELARAERYAQDHDWRVAWEHDHYADDSFVEIWDEAERDEWRNQEHECLTAVLYNEAGEVLASLGGIFDPDVDYIREVNAELALEALANIEREQRNAQECASLMAS